MASNNDFMMQLAAALDAARLIPTLNSWKRQ